MKKRMQEQSLRTITLAAVGFVALLVAVPEWARVGVIVFALVFGWLAYAVDASVREAVWCVLDSPRRSPPSNDTAAKSTGAKSPAARRAAT